MIVHLGLQCRLITRRTLFTVKMNERMNDRLGQVFVPICFVCRKYILTRKISNIIYVTLERFILTRKEF